MGVTDEERRVRLQALERLWEEGRRAVGQGKRFVPGEGSPVAQLMIVGEAPGEEEEAQGRPFVGRAGQLLNRVLAEVGIPREQAWITNVVKWRPTAERQGKAVNRPPTGAEVRVGESLLRREIDIIRPGVILCLGNVAARAIISKDFEMSEGRGRWYDGPLGSRAIATFHPAYVLRWRGAGREDVVRTFRRDLQAVRAAIPPARSDP